MSRKIPVIAAIVLLNRTAGAESPEGSYQLRFEKSLRDAKGMPLYVDDAEITKTIPQFAELGIRISTCIAGMIRPEPLAVAFTPTLTGPHQALSNTLNCVKAEDADVLTCWPHVHEHAVIFDVDQTKYFEIDANTDPEDALAVYRAFRDGQISFPDGAGPRIKALPVRQITRDGDRFLLMNADCGCHETFAISRRVSGGATTFEGTKIEGMCI
jgi:hypothetical protein